MNFFSRAKRTKKKRNGQKQKDHLEEARAIRDIRMKREGKDWINRDGTPEKKDVVEAREGK